MCFRVEPFLTGARLHLLDTRRAACNWAANGSPAFPPCPFRLEPRQFPDQSRKARLACAPLVFCRSIFAGPNKDIARSHQTDVRFSGLAVHGARSERLPDRAQSANVLKLASGTVGLR